MITGSKRPAWSDISAGRATSQLYQMYSVNIAVCLPAHKILYKHCLLCYHGCIIIISKVFRVLVLIV